MVGDAERDIDAGLAAGLPRDRCLRVGQEGDVPDLLAASDRIVPQTQTAGTHVTLRALSGEPLADRAIRDTVESTAHALAERTGISILWLKTTSTAIHVTLPTDRFGAMGFAAELRRLTNAWYEAKFRDGPLWGTSREE